MHIPRWMNSLRVALRGAVAVAVIAGAMTVQPSAPAAAQEADSTAAAQEAPAAADPHAGIQQAYDKVAQELEQASTPPPPKFWLGISGSPANEVLQKQLGIAGGMVVDHVAEDSPATQAGIQPHDILLKFGGNDVNKIEELIAALQSSTGEETQVVLLREGEETTLKITPQLRPEQQAAVNPNEPIFRNLNDLAAYYQQHPKGEGIVIWNLQPGMLMPRNQLFVHYPNGLQALPADVTITIKKPEDGPSRIAVQYAGKSWSVTDAELDKLPEILRKPVQQMLLGAAPGQLPSFRGTWADLAQSRAGLANALVARAVPQVAQPAAPQPAKQAALPDAQSTTSGDVAEKLDAVLKKLDALQQEVSALKKANESAQQ